MIRLSTVNQQERPPAPTCTCQGVWSKYGYVVSHAAACPLAEHNQRYSLSSAATAARSFSSVATDGGHSPHSPRARASSSSASSSRTAATSLSTSVVMGQSLSAVDQRSRREAFKREREQHAASEHFGTVGARTELTLQVSRVFETEGRYGVTYITTLHDAAGNEFKWFGSYELERGSTVKAKWTIKAHEEWKGTKQTVLTRPGGLETLADVQTEIVVAA